MLIREAAKGLRKAGTDTSEPGHLLPRAALAFSLCEERLSPTPSVMGTW